MPEPESLANAAGAIPTAHTRAPTPRHEERRLNVTSSIASLLGRSRRSRHGIDATLEEGHREVELAAETIAVAHVHTVNERPWTPSGAPRHEAGARQAPRARHLRAVSTGGGDLPAVQCSELSRTVGGGVCGVENRRHYNGVIQQKAPAGLGVQSWAVKGAFFAHATLASMHVPPGLPLPASATPASRPGPASTKVRQHRSLPGPVRLSVVLQSCTLLGASLAHAPTAAGTHVPAAAAHALVRPPSISRPTTRGLPLQSAAGAAAPRTTDAVNSADFIGHFRGSIEASRCALESERAVPEWPPLRWIRRKSKRKSLARPGAPAYDLSTRWRARPSTSSGSRPLGVRRATRS